jgi:hypothetical protein
MPTNHSQNQEDLDTKVFNLEQKLDSFHIDLQASLEKQYKEMTHLLKGKNVDPSLEDPRSFHYENSHYFCSPLDSPQYWTKVPKVDMLIFDGSNPIGWVSQMEQYFSLHDIRDDEEKIHVGILYLDKERWKCLEWHKKCYPRIPTWNMFTKAVCPHFDPESHFFIRLNKSHRTSLVSNFIMEFEQLDI